MSALTLTSGDATTFGTAADTGVVAFGGTITHNITFWVLISTAVLIVSVLAYLKHRASNLGRRG